MRYLVALLITVSLALPVRAAELPEGRLKELVKRAGQGQLEEIAGEVAPGEFEARPLVEQVVVCTGTDALRTLVSLGDASPLRKMVPAATWPKLVKSQPTLERVAAAMRTALHGTVTKALASRDVAASRLLVGTANLYLRQMGEAESAAEKAIFLFVANTAAEVVSNADLQTAMIKLSTDPLATAEVRERAGFLYPLIADTAARAKVAVLQFHTQLGGR